MARHSSVGSAYSACGKGLLEEKDIVRTIKLQDKTQKFFDKLQIGDVCNLGKLMYKTEKVYGFMKDGWMQTYTINQIISTRWERVTDKWLKKQIEKGKTMAEIARNCGVETSFVVKRIHSLKRKGEVI